MKLNRRNTLIGLGTIVAGGGAALGTGAFSSVEADRTVDVNTESDDAALLELNIANDDLGGDGDTIEFDIDNLNQNAVTRFEDALEISYDDSAETASSYTLEIEDESGESILDEDGDASGDPPIYFEGEETLDDGGVNLDIVFDLRDNDEDDLSDDEITIRASDE
jgi:hypothetical protein